MGLRALGSVPAEVMARLTAAEQAAAEANGRAEAARLEAVKAEATGQNARQMVLTRDVKIAEAETVAANAAAKVDAIDVKRSEYEAAVAASLADRADIRARLESTAADVAANKAAIERLTAALGKPDALGSRGIAALLLNGQSTVTVQLSRPMPNLNYRIEMTHSAVVTLAAGMLVETGRTTSTVTVRVTAVGVALAAGTLHVGAREG